ncbi:unnamed protein product [Linum tenue]|uniref:Uncharacterized protein n=1 Tax=Linum tenue TaxID=586396 RepID=A0AAV0K854_9ROSI|nr:unnamed protein product [Linum tenue]
MGRVRPGQQPTGPEEHNLDHPPHRRHWGEQRQHRRGGADQQDHHPRQRQLHRELRRQPAAAVQRDHLPGGRRHLAVERQRAGAGGAGDRDRALRAAAGAVRNGGEGEARGRRPVGPGRRRDGEVSCVLQSIEERVCWADEQEDEARVY